jgi:hypothetical protein
MMHHVQRTGLTAHAVVGQLERRVRRRTLSFAGRKAMPEAELMTFARFRASLRLTERGAAKFARSARPTAAAAAEFMVLAGTRKQKA